MLEKITSLLKEYQPLITTAYDLEKIHDVHGVRTFAINFELATEIEALQGLAAAKSAEDFREKFLQRCIEREKINQGSTLSFFAMPDGACNQLYFKIAMAVFECKNLPELLVVLLPSIQKCVVPILSLSKDTHKQTQDRLQVTFQAQNIDIALAEEKPDSKVFYRLVTDGINLFDMQELISLNFTQHQLYHHAIFSAYPTLAKAIYQHNSDFTTLHDNVLRLTGQNATPKDFIERFSLKLHHGSSHMTGSVHASLSAQQAMTDFMHYLNSLPENQLHDLNSLEDAQNKTFKSVINDLKNGNCVEVAAMHLKGIIDNPVNQAILTTHPRLSEDYIRGIKGQYRATKPLQADGIDDTITIPNSYLKKALASIHIANMEELLDFLISFDPTFYGLLLQNASLDDPTRLLDADQDWLQVLNEQQRQACINAIIDARERFGGAGTLLRFAARSYPDVLKVMLEIYPVDARLAAVKEKDEGGYTALHYSSLNSDSLKVILELYQTEERLAAINERSRLGQTVLHLATMNPDSLKFILGLYPVDARLAAIKKKAEDGSTVLHYATNNPDSLKFILELYPVEGRLAAVKEKNEEGYTALHCAAIKPDSLKFILELYPVEERLAAIKEKTLNGQTVLHIGSFNPDCLKIILELYPVEERLAAIAERTLNGVTVLHEACLNPDSIKIIFELFPMDSLLVVCKEKDKWGNTVLHRLIQNPNGLKAILGLYPVEARLAAINEKTQFGMTVLHLATMNPDSLKVILELLPFDARLAAVNEQNKFGTSVLHTATYNSDSLKAILELYPVEERATIIKQKNLKGSTVLHLAAGHHDSLKVIFECFPEAQTILLQDRIAKMLINARRQTLLDDDPNKNAKLDSFRQFSINITKAGLADTVQSLKESSNYDQLIAGWMGTEVFKLLEQLDVLTNTSIDLSNSGDYAMTEQDKIALLSIQLQINILNIEDSLSKEDTKIARLQELQSSIRQAGISKTGISQAEFIQALNDFKSHNGRDAARSGLFAKRQPLPQHFDLEHDRRLAP